MGKLNTATVSDLVRIADATWDGCEGRKKKVGFVEEEGSGVAMINTMAIVLIVSLAGLVGLVMSLV